MPHASLKLIPGVDQNKTPALNEAAISESNLIRFVPDRAGMGLVQKLGGWNLFYTQSPIESSVRALLGWQSLSDATYLGVGAEQSLSVISNNNLNRITPQSYVVNLPAKLQTTQNDPKVTIFDYDGDIDDFDSVYIETQITIGGLRLQGIYQCYRISADSYYIIARDVLGNEQPATSPSSTAYLPQFTAAIANKSVVRVYLPEHGYLPGDTVAFLVPTVVGGITVYGNYIVIQDSTDEAQNLNYFKISTNALATSDETRYINNNLARYKYYNGIGPVALGSGYGVAGYGDGGFGTGVVPVPNRQLQIIGVTGSGTEVAASFVMQQNATAPSGAMYVRPGTTITVSGITPSGFNVSSFATVSAAQSYSSNIINIVGNGTYVTILHDGNYTVPANRAINVYDVNPSSYNTNYLVVGSTLSSDIATSTLSSISGNTLTVGGIVSGKFTIGQTITGSGISAGTTITGLGPATSGGAGTYYVSISQTAASTAITATATYSTIIVQDSTSDAYVSGGRVVYNSLTYANTTNGTYFEPGGTIAIASYPGISANDWTLDNWGEILLSCPDNTPTNFGQPDNKLAGGPIFYWQPESGTPVANVIPTSPPANHGIFVAMPQRQVIAWGSTFNGIQDPLLIRWSDVGNFTVWAGTLTNQAGSYRIPKGSRIVGCIQGPQQALVWTDLAIWAMQYVGQPYVYSFNEIGNGCGLIAPKAAASLGGVVYWMSQSQFFRLSGSGIEPIACPVWDVVFQQIDQDHLDKIRVAPNSRFGEISWFYPIQGSNGVPTNYVKYNAYMNQWDFGTLTRTAWINQSVLGPPIGAGPVEGGSGNGYLIQHETSVDAVDANNLPVAMNSSFTTGYFQLNDGDLLTFVDQWWPDAKWGLYNNTNQGAQLSLTFYVTNYATDDPIVYGPYTLSEAIEYVTPRLRGRLVSMKLESNDVGSFWRLGNMRYRFQQDGKF